MNVITKDLARINSGRRPKHPFLFDWGAPLQSDWNIHVWKNFLADFWAHVEAGVYSANLIPEKYQQMDEFNMVYSQHMSHLKKCWTDQQKPLSDEEIQKRGKSSSHNSQIGMVSCSVRSYAVHMNFPADI